MVERSADEASLAALMGPLAAQSGITASALPGVSFQRITAPLARSPAVYQPSLKIVGQGSIRSYLGREVHSYDADHYLALVVPLPVECEIQASLAEPVLFMSIDLDWTLLGTLLAEMGLTDLAKGDLPRAVRAAPLTAGLREATLRLLRCLHDPGDARVLGPSIRREILYRALQGPMENVLRAGAARQGGFARIGRALRLLHRDYAGALGVEQMARTAGMSVPTFYRCFKTVTATSPSRYLQRIRLHQARSLLRHERLPVAVAARRVGYESPSQFSREFRRLFGRSPTADLKLPPEA